MRLCLRAGRIGTKSEPHHAHPHQNVDCRSRFLFIVSLFTLNTRGCSSTYGSRSRLPPQLRVPRDPRWSHDRTSSSAEHLFIVIGLFSKVILHSLEFPEPHLRHLYMHHIRNEQPQRRSCAARPATPPGPHQARADRQYPQSPRSDAHQIYTRYHATMDNNTYPAGRFAGAFQCP